MDAPETRSKPLQRASRVPSVAPDLLPFPHFGGRVDEPGDRKERSVTTHEKAIDEHQDGVITKVRPVSDGYEITFDDFGCLYVKDPGFEIHEGDPYRSYGKGFGFPVRGLDIAGREAYYQTEEEYWADFREAQEKREREHGEFLEAKGGVFHDPGTGKYDWREGMDEISGFGEEYEAACRSMLIRTLDFWDEQPEDFDPKYHSYENITGVMVDDNDDAKLLDKAMMDAEIVFGNGERERCGDGASGAMHQAVVSHAFFARANGWEKYVEHMSSRGKD